MAVRIRMKKMGRRHQPYYRLCVMDSRTPRDGKVIEEVGTYDPLVRDTDKRCTMKAERIDYWLSVGALPTEKVKILIDKYKGKVPEVRLDRPREKSIPAPMPVLVPPRGQEGSAPAETATGEAPATEAPAEDSASE